LNICRQELEALKNELEETVRSLDNDCGLLKKKLEEAISKEDYITAGKLQVEELTKTPQLKVNRRDLESTKKSLSAIVEKSDEVLNFHPSELHELAHSIEAECRLLETKLNESLSKKDYISAGKIQKQIQGKTKNLKWIQQNIERIPEKVVLKGHNAEAFQKAKKGSQNIDIEFSKPENINGWTPLLQSCLKGEIDCVKHLILEKADIEEAHTSGTTPFYIACEKGHLNIVNELIRVSADINKSRIDGSTPLMTASEFGHFHIIHELIKSKTDINKTKKDGTASLWYACQNNNSNIVKALLDSNANTNQIIENGWTPLFRSCYNGHLEIVKQLLWAKSDIEKSLMDNTTPFYLACEFGHIDVVKELVLAKADINKAKNNGQTPLSKACQKKHFTVSQELIKEGAIINMAMEDGGTPLYFSSANGHNDIAGLLIEKKADVNRDTIFGYSPLFIACHNGHISIVQMLIDSKADINKTVKQRNPDCSKQHGLKTIDISKNGYNCCICGEMSISIGKQIFLCQKCNWGCCENCFNTTADGATPLFIACQRGYLKIVQCLVNSSADIYKAKNDGTTPLQVSENGDRLDIIAFLENVRC